MIIIKSGGPVFVKVPEPLQPLNKDQSIKLECIIEANPNPTVNWYENKWNKIEFISFKEIFLIISF